MTTGTRERRIQLDDEGTAGMAIWQAQFARERDFVESPEPTVRYLLCSAPRSGSHFLAGLLHETGMFGCPLEYFNPNNLPRWKERASEEGWDDVVPFLESIRTSPNGVFGMIVHYMQLPAVEPHVPLARLAREYRFIVLERDDLLAQAVSLVLAGQDGKFIEERRQATEPLDARRSEPGYKYQRRQIQHHMRLIASNYARWRIALDSLGVPYLKVRYEEIVEDRTSVIRRIADHLAIELPRDFVAPEPRTRKQHHPLKSMWKRRFLTESREPDVTLDDLDCATGSALL